MNFDDENLLIPLPGLSLPDSYPRQIGFVALVNDQLRRLRATGHYVPGRFFGFYFRKNQPVSVCGSWTVILHRNEPVSLLLGMVNDVSAGRFSIETQTENPPDFLLIHDRRYGSCWLWTYAEGLEFVEAVEPVSGNTLDDEKSNLPDSQ